MIHMVALKDFREKILGTLFIMKKGKVFRVKNRLIQKEMIKRGAAKIYDKDNIIKKEEKEKVTPLEALKRGAKSVKKTGRRYSNTNDGYTPVKTDKVIQSPEMQNVEVKEISEIPEKKETPPETEFLKIEDDEVEEKTNKGKAMLSKLFNRSKKG